MVDIIPQLASHQEHTDKGFILTVLILLKLHLPPISQYSVGNQVPTLLDDFLNTNLVSFPL